MFNTLKTQTSSDLFTYLNLSFIYFLLLLWSIRHVFFILKAMSIKASAEYISVNVKRLYI